ncbi:hypothetical protein [Streptomyces sp. JW3]|uniref:hypothetical protein n=1 Tax=Streptomyces sp. JW3 TaxID=3456955 RepID=UPI003FA44B3E
MVVTLPVADGRKSVATTVKTTTNDQLRTGDFVQVLYAPARPELGAVAGDKRSLEWKLRGLTMPTFERWGFIVLWVICLLASVYHVWDRYSFRSMSRLGGADRALRGSYTREGGSSAAEGGPATEGGVYLEVQTHGERVRFHADTGQFGLPEAMKGEHLWLCWDTRRGARGGRLSASRTPAALIFDTDVVVHGMISVQQARRLCGHAAPVEKTGTPARQQCSLRLFDVRSCWPLYASPLSLQAAAVVIACAVALTFEITGGWRFAFGVIGLLGVLVVAGDVLAGNVPATRVGRVPS